MYDVYSCVFQQCWTINAEDNKCMAVSLALSDANVNSYAPSPADFSFARPGPGFSQIHDNTLKTFSALRVLILRILLSSHNRKRWIWKCYGKRNKKMNETRKQGNRKTWTKIKMRASRKLRFTPLIDTLSWRKPSLRTKLHKNNTMLSNLTRHWCFGISILIRCFSRNWAYFLCNTHARAAKTIHERFCPTAWHICGA